MYIPVSGQLVPISSSYEKSLDAIFGYVSNSAEKAKLLTAWERVFKAYVQKSRSFEKWFHHGCGGGVDDSKNLPGLDRTDDIKKASYQVLKIRSTYDSPTVFAGVAANLGAVRHHTCYIRPIENLLTFHKDKGEKANSYWRVKTGDVHPVYDCILTLMEFAVYNDKLKELIDG
ncbi:MAG: hypothetical protein A2Y63_05000 [Candidatus Riflebacteria bacterium RBG_13_59_9]|nr:MAG: hypothetical protein A2Y63_05000 [Candidatus Riflebacteria bacterium RBG_13_59_9]